MWILLVMLPVGSLPGQKDDLEGLFRQLYKPVVGFFSRRGCTCDLCEDLAQETLFRAFKGRDGFRAEAKPSTWVNVRESKIADAAQIIP